MAYAPSEPMLHQSVDGVAWTPTGLPQYEHVTYDGAELFAGGDGSGNIGWSTNLLGFALNVYQLYLFCRFGCNGGDNDYMDALPLPTAHKRRMRMNGKFSDHGNKSNLSSSSLRLGRLKLNKD